MRFASLQQANRLGLIEDDALRADILGYYEDEQTKVSQFRGMHNDWTERLTLAWWPYMRTRSRQDPEMPLKDPPPVEEFVGSWSDLRADAEVLNLIGIIGTVAGIAADYIEDQIELNVALRGRIQAVLAPAD